jgi:two-component system nitrate/nitrite response regulator NarL
LVLAGLAEARTCAAAMRIKLAGFLPKDRRVSELVDALEVIAQGGVAFDPRLARRATKDASGTRHRSRPAYVLTPREKEVLRRIVAGQSTVQMADEMNVTTSTLRTYVKNLLAKLGAHSRLQAAALAARGDFPDELSA